MNWVFMSVAVAPGRPRAEPGTIRGPGEIVLVNGPNVWKNVGSGKGNEGDSEWFLPRAHVFCQGDFCPLSAAAPLLPVFNDVLTPVSICFPAPLFLSSQPYYCLPLSPECWPWLEIWRTKASVRIGFLWDTATWWVCRRTLSLLLTPCEHF